MILEIKLGSAKEDITPPVGTELGGYAGYRPCSGVHDHLYCRALVLSQEGVRYGLISLDLLSVDESLCQRIAEMLSPLGIAPERLLISAIHSHAAPCGMILGEGPLARVNQVAERDPEGYMAYMHNVIAAAKAAFEKALQEMEPFVVRWAQGALPALGSERHTGEPAQGELTALELRTDSGRRVVVYHFPCHPTVMRPENLEVSCDMIGSIEGYLGADMAVFLNGAAGDISTRFTRQESSFRECDRMGTVAAQSILQLLETTAFAQPTPIQSIHTSIQLEPRPVDPLEHARQQLQKWSQRLEQAKAEGKASAELRVIQSFVEGAGVNLEFSKTMQGIRQLSLPVTVLRFCGLKAVSIPGELFSSLRPKGALAVCYTNGYYRYIADTAAYDAGYYEAMAAILAKGQGEKMMEQISLLLNTLE